MVNATIDNAPVSVQLGLDQSTTVPSNETWKVTLSCGGISGSGTDFRGFEINGTTVATFGMATSNNNLPILSEGLDVVLNGGDTIKLIHDQGGTGGGGIQGFVVDS